MLGETYKAKELADKVAAAIFNILEEDFEGIKNIDCVMGILTGATAVITCVHHSMDVDDPDKLTAGLLTHWAAMYTTNTDGKPDPEK